MHVCMGERVEQCLSGSVQLDIEMPLTLALLDLHCCVLRKYIFLN